MLQLKYSQKQRFYMDTFKVWDEEGKGKVNAANIRSVLSNMNIKINQKEAEVDLLTIL